MLLLLLIQLSGTSHAIHVQNDAGYVGSLIGSQECKSVGYIFGLPHAPQGNSLNHGLDDFLGNGLHHTVSVIPGATAFTRIPFGPSSLARELVMPLTANLDAGYANPPG